MDLTRRAALAATAAFAASPALAQPHGRPIVIAHRGASGLRPEHTLAAYRLAVEQGADFIEPDLVLTRDGQFVARHENEIAGTTDVASRPEFAARKRSKVIDGQTVDGWFTEDFTLAELKTLPALRPESARFDGQEAIPTFQEVIDLAKAESRRTGRTIGVYPEMKHPTYYAGVGLPMEMRLAALLRRNDLDSPAAPVFVQCFEAAPLRTLMTVCRARRVMLVGQGPAPVDVRSEAGIRAIAAFADGLGPEWPLVVPIVDGGLAPPTQLVAWAHAARLAVHPWTVRAENAFLPPKLRRGSTPAEHGDAEAVFKALYAAGVDGLFSDFPGLAVAARG